MFRDFAEAVIDCLTGMLVIVTALMMAVAIFGSIGFTISWLLLR
jgi:hypothetical protein